MTSIFTVVVAIAIVTATAAAAQTQISPTMALSIARAIGKYTGYTTNKARIMDYEITDRPEKRAYRGYITVQMMENAHPVFNISINTISGQAADFLGCYIFEYPIIGYVEERQGFKGERQLGYSKMMGDNGCDKYIVLKRPGDEGRALPSHPVDSN
jgi:hypothetical protein